MLYYINIDCTRGLHGKLSPREKQDIGFQGVQKIERQRKTMKHKSKQRVIFVHSKKKNEIFKQFYLKKN